MYMNKVPWPLYNDTLKRGTFYDLVPKNSYPCLKVNHYAEWASLNYALSYDIPVHSNYHLGVNLNITVYKDTVPWPLYNDTLKRWPLYDLSTKFHTHDLWYTIMLNGALWTVHSAMMLKRLISACHLRHAKCLAQWYGTFMNDMHAGTEEKLTNMSVQFQIAFPLI